MIAETEDMEMRKPGRPKTAKGTRGDYIKITLHPDEAKVINDAMAEWERMKAEHAEVHVSESGSRYIVVDDTVFRYADHWNTVGSCHWGIEARDIAGPKVLNVLGKEVQLLSIGAWLNKGNVPAIGKASLEDFKLNRQVRI